MRPQSADSSNDTLEESSSLHIAELYSELTAANIMMVDDEPLLMEVLEILLEEKGYHNFIKIEDSREAISAVAEMRPDVLLLDLNMPNVDGFDILRAVRSNPDTQHMPVIILTSSSDSKSKLQALELGATDFLAKPVDGSELSLRLRNTLLVKAYQEQLTYYDFLTHLPNRKLFIDRLDWLLAKSKRDSNRVAVVKIGLDRFKKINDSLGPALADRVLQEVSERLMATVRESDVVSRLGSYDLWRQLGRVGGDEFSIALTGLDTSSDAQYIAARIHESLTKIIRVEHHELYLTASIGIAVYPDDGTETDKLIKNAGAATEYAKQQGRGLTQFYSSEINAHSRRRLSMEAALRKAIEQEEFVLHFQPKIHSLTGEVTDCEALIRWESPELGLVGPGEFIELAEEADLIMPIGEWVLFEVCRQQVLWKREGVCDVKVSANVAGVQFGKGSLKHVVKECLDASGINPEKLNLEITETMLMTNAEGLLSLLHDIRAMGPSFSIDDFGTGYSSLAYLKRFPVEELKIDRSFIVDLPGAVDDQAIVRAIIAMAHTLDLSVVAEGVEELAQFNFLKQAGCDVIQGYYFSKPLPADEFAAFVGRFPAR
ncbi:MAG: EAL domain-containing protein [Halioglobus sp.]